MLQFRLRAVLQSTQKQEALARHRDLFKRLREIRDSASTCDSETQDAKQTSWNYVGVEPVSDEDPDSASMGPAGGQQPRQAPRP